MSYPTVSDYPDVQAAYEAMREAGQSHNMAELLACRQCPSLRTNTSFIAAENNRKPYYGLEENQKHSNALRKTARRLNAHPNNYNPTLADYPGDPKAFLPNDDPMGHIKKITRQREEAIKQGVGT